MKPDLADYRSSCREQERIADLMGLLPAGETALDVGARDGYISRCLAQRFRCVTALDLERPSIEHPRILPVKGDATALEFGDRSFDVVLCAEVLEHMPGLALRRACDELARVMRGALIIGVPYKQDLRLGRTRCAQCGQISPPWGHVNAFDERRLAELFPSLRIDKTSYVGETREGTSLLASWLMDQAGNPYGTYEQEEPCVHCGAELSSPASTTLWQRFPAKISVVLDRIQQSRARPKPRWIHVRLVHGSS
jgi:hypothetical protein